MTTVWMRWMRINELYEAGRVKRLHCKATVAEHTIAQHVYGSLVLAVELCALNPGCRLDRVMLALLYHDGAELRTGDVPAPVKRENPVLAQAFQELEQAWERKMQLPIPELTEFEQAVVKACDTLDLAFNVLHERMMGNTNEWVRRVFLNCQRYLEEQIHVVGVRELREHLSHSSSWAKGV